LAVLAIANLSRPFAMGSACAQILGLGNRFASDPLVIHKQWRPTVNKTGGLLRRLSYDYWYNWDYDGAIVREPFLQFCKDGGQIGKPIRTS
jgi:hypothetical protein